MTWLLWQQPTLTQGTARNVNRVRGEYQELRACSCSYDCRIIFYLERDEKTQTDRIVLINIGTHDEVY
ncbi:plasmid stabilization protein [Microcystis aeruginosa KLA2]|nr:plasmid stabilization protein [Microcystis aeruginosa L311-01]TRU12265.1 MAG: plasmid stabilization protein [Microcystis sp. Msp_OC_L_20101000_S702]TRU20657.1 MAG: plasmid stabilization protein [Microcystis aeruginosa Ma_MB_S_20031200_S102D]TYT71825.1 plasmid stabilization protein [Microcystis aeruginosa KLA2]